MTHPFDAIDTRLPDDWTIDTDRRDDSTREYDLVVAERPDYHLNGASKPIVCVRPLDRDEWDIFTTLGLGHKWTTTRPTDATAADAFVDAVCLWEAERQAKAALWNQTDYYTNPVAAVTAPDPDRDDAREWLQAVGDAQDELADATVTETMATTEQATLVEAAGTDD